MEDLLSHKEIALMRKLGRVAYTFLRKLRKVLRPGITTKDIEGRFDKYIYKYSNMSSAFLGYNDYPASLCVSVNEEIIHGIPQKNKVIKDGDLVSVDLGLKHNGLFVDCAYTYLVGRSSRLQKKMVKVGLQALGEGIKQSKVGNTINDIGCAIQKVTESNGFSVIRKFVGHGIGRSLHCFPEVPNFGDKSNDTILEEGMVLAIEPMISNGDYEVEVLGDGWTAKTKDNSLSCHFEHTVAITKNGPRVLTK